MLANSVNKNQKKREFSLEKIATAIRCGNLISSIRNKYKDPLIIRHKNQLFQKIKRKLELNQNEDEEEEDPFSLNKILCHKFIKQKQKTESEGDKAIQTKNSSSFKILPLISNKNKNLKQTNNDTLLVTSGMFKQKEYCKDPAQKVKLGNIINLKANGDKLIYNLYPKIENIKNINDKYNLQLDLNYLNNNQNYKTPKKMTKNILKHYLFYKYSSSSPNGITIDNYNTKTEQKHKKRHRTNQKYNSSRNNQIFNDEAIKKNTLSDNDFQYETIDNYKKNNFNDDTNTFITKLNVDTDGKQTLKNDTISKQENNSKKKDLFEKNKNIINYDQKVSIDCLYSNVISHLENKKLVYKSIDKTTFELQKEPSYKRFKNFESIIDEVIKNKKNKQYKKYN